MGGQYSLPSEIYHGVACYAPDSELLRCRLVAREWAHVAGAQARFLHHHRSEQLERLKAALPAWKLSLIDCNPLAPIDYGRVTPFVDWMMLVGRTLPCLGNVRILLLERCSVTDCDVSRIETLSLNRCTGRLNAALLSSLKQFLIVPERDHPPVLDMALLPLGALEKLTVSRCHVDLSRLTNVRELKLTSCTVEGTLNSPDLCELVTIDTADVRVLATGNVRQLRPYHGGLLAPDRIDQSTFPALVSLTMHSARDCSALGYVEQLDLSHSSVADVSMLGCVRHLDLERTHVVDVSALGGVCSLNLSRCLVHDVSALGGVVNLNLAGCPVSDVSALGNVTTLDLSDCHIEDVSMLGTVRHLALARCPVADVDALGGVHTLDLRDCRRVTNVAALGRVHTLDLSGCPVTDVDALGGVHTLNLSGCPVTNVDALGGVHTLDLSDCCRVTNVSALGGVHTLYLSGCPVTDVNNLGGVHTLILKGCAELRDVDNLGGVHKLNLSGCTVKDVSMLGSVHYLVAPLCRDYSALGSCDTLVITTRLPEYAEIAALPEVSRAALARVRVLRL